MARKRKEEDPKIKLKHPNRSGPDPSQATLLQLAEQRGLLNTPPQAITEEKAEPAAEEPLIGRLAESIFWCISLTMLHFTMDVLVSHQYAVEIEWPKLVSRGASAFPGTLFLTPFCSDVRYAHAFEYSLSPPLLRSASSSLTPSVSPQPTASDPTYLTPALLLHK